MKNMKKPSALFYSFSKIIALANEGIELAATELWLNDNAERYCRNSRPLSGFWACERLTGCGALSHEKLKINLTKVKKKKVS